MEFEKSSYRLQFTAVLLLDEYNEHRLGLEYYTNSYVLTVMPF
jgi:hypothetical protein